MNNNEKFFILKRERYYNPFYAEIGAKLYELGEICIFDADGVRCRTCSGWFGNNNNYYPELRVDGCECVRKKAVDLTSKTAFIIPTEPFFGRKRYALYIPAAVAGCEPPTVARGYDGRFFRIIWKLSNIGGGEVVEKWHFVDAGLHALEMVAEEEAKRIEWRSTPDTLKEVAATLKRVEKKLRAEWERVRAITPDEVLKDYR